MSYLFFRILHVMIDRREEVIERPVGFAAYFEYLINFTAIVSGPIQRFEAFQQDEIAPLPLDGAALGLATRRIVVGCGKVFVLSIILQMARPEIFAALLRQTSAPDRAAVAALYIAQYPLFLFCNFSGYTDVVIGVARLYRKSLPENFDRPFSATNFILFWSRWHMSLSNWLKTYIYNPLLAAMMERFSSPRAAPYFAVAAFFVTFSLVGVWHGQTTEFLMFGLLQGGGVALNKVYQLAIAGWLGRLGYRTLCGRALYISLSRGLTFTYFAFTLLWFSSDWSHIAALAQGAGVAGAAGALLLIWLTSAALLSGWEICLRAGARAAPAGGRSLVDVLNSRYAQTAWLTAIGLATVVVVIALNAPAPEIVYKTF
jgi:D-alanyl-lipoteichoic acid acyltransferase DltB (MBOAT superfamily)